ncbi:MAG: protein of unassigned function [Enterovirga sp.]|nr:protein of unassigned function [Enterovirga sp.]
MSPFRFDPAAALGALPARLARWRAGAGGRGSPRIAVVGNCQGAAITTAMRLLLPEAEIAYHSVHAVARRFPRMSDLVRAVSGCDVVFAGHFTAPFRDGGDFETLRAETRLVPIPVVVFSAFHPDAVYVGDMADNTRLVRTPVGYYNSALALFGFLKGLTPTETLRLFDFETYRYLGYMDAWRDAQATLLQLGRDAGYDLETDFLRWSRRGVFMHVINHPRMFVTNDLARGLLRKAGIPFADCDLDSFASDEIAALGAWPVYPPIAEQYGVPGSEVFLRPAARRRPPATIGLTDFVHQSFAAYRAADPALLRNDRVAHWLAADGIADDLAARARG